MKKTSTLRKQNGFTLVECLVATVVMTIGILSLAGVFAKGLQNNYQAQIQYIAQQKAQEALETIFTARDTKLLQWAQIANVSNGGVFEDNAQQLCASGPDGLFGTQDDDCTNPDVIVLGPGPDGVFGTADDVKANLNPWMTRTIQITPAVTVPPTLGLNKVVITINWTFEGQSSSFVLVSYISDFS